jgi:hypothetical protein
VADTGNYLIERCLDLAAGFITSHRIGRKPVGLGQLLTRVVSLAIVAPSLLRHEFSVPRPRNRKSVSKLRKHPVGRQPWNNRFPNIRPVTAPPEVGWMAHKTRPHRIQVDITREFEEVTLGIYQQCTISALEQMPTAAGPMVDPSSISERDILNDLCEWDLADLYGQVDVIIHAAKRMHTMTEPHHPFIDQREESPVVRILHKD